MKYLYLTILLVLLPLAVTAQISVESFVQLNDADARANFPVIDDDGTVCALIKIVTTAQDFTFDAGQLPIVKTSYEHAGEVWVYVPEGTMKLKISHKDLGNLRGADVHNDGYYYFPTNRLKRATSYRMVLTHKEVIKYIEGNGETNVITFKCNVEDAEVWVGNNLAGNIKNGIFKITWPKGLLFEYRIHKDYYEDVTGKFRNDKEDITQNINLISYYNGLEVKTSTFDNKSKSSSKHISSKKSKTVSQSFLDQTPFNKNMFYCGLGYQKTCIDLLDIISVPLKSGS